MEKATQTDQITTKKKWSTPKVKYENVADRTKAGFSGVIVENAFYTDS